MAWESNLSTFSQEQAEAFWETYSWAIRQSPPAKSKNTQGEYSCSDSETDGCQTFRYGTISEPCAKITPNAQPPLPLGSRSEMNSLCAEGSRAKTFQAQEKAKESTANEVDCGERWQESLAKYDPDSRSWKTRQYSLLGGLIAYSETFPKWGIMRNGELYPAETQAVFIYESGYGLSLPTPRSCTAMSARVTANTAKAKNPSLETVLAQLYLPTIVKSEHKGTSKSRYIGSPDFRGAMMSEGLRTCEQDPIYLSPSFGELVMMWPVGWTDLQPLGMDKHREWLQQHGGS